MEVKMQINKLELKNIKYFASMMKKLLAIVQTFLLMVKKLFMFQIMDMVLVTIYTYPFTYKM